MSVNFIVEAIHHTVGDEDIEVLEYNSILVGDGWGSHEVMREECTSSLLTNHINSLGLTFSDGVKYKTVMSITITFTEDYYGEADAEASVILLYHAEAIDMTDESINTQHDIEWVPLQTVGGAVTTSTHTNR